MLRILIADDNPVFRKALRHLLERVDYWQVIEASDGQEAVARSVETRPDVIFLDLAMPGKDGFAAAQEISTLLPETPILMCTMHKSRHLEAEARKHGIRKVISKTESNAVVPAIRQLFNEQKAGQQTLAAETISPALPVPPVSTVDSTTPTVAPSTDAISATPKNAA
jgi:CheY-like chemotaxis protein